MGSFELKDLGTLASIIALIFVWLQLRQNYRLSRASFINSINSELNQFAKVRVFLRNFEEDGEIDQIRGQDYERTLDYLTSFENIYWMINLNVLRVDEAKEYFGSRFYEAFHSSFFIRKCDEDESFRLMYSILFKMYELFEDDSSIVGHAKMYWPQEQQDI